MTEIIILIFYGQEPGVRYNEINYEMSRRKSWYKLRLLRMNVMKIWSLGWKLFLQHEEALEVCIVRCISIQFFTIENILIFIMQSKLCYFDNQQKQKIFYFNRKSQRRDLKKIKESYFFLNSTPGIEPRAENFIAHEMSSSSKSREKFFTSSENQFRILFLSFNFTSRLLMVVVLAIQALN